MIFSAARHWAWRRDELTMATKGTKSPWRAITVCGKRSGDTGSDSALIWVEDRIKDCLTQHPRCTYDPGAAVPARLVDVATEGSDVRLYETHGEDAKYVCLSHCWGPSRKAVTTRKNLKTYIEAIPWTALPKAFQDAISFVRKLGIRYLWIDSLCIIQDDKKDWEKEAAAMCSVYEHSYLTLAATGSPSDDQNFFSRASDREIKGTTMEGTPYHVFVRPCIPHPRYWKAEGKTWPLLSRAWIYQERLLSPRVLHFGKEELFWECNENQCCECGDLEEWTKRDSGPPKMNHTKILSHPSREKLMERWHMIVEEYTTLELTVPSDRLPALLGVAMQMQPKRRGAYLAGLWTDSVIEDLLWHPAEPWAGPCRRPTEPRAPTWSWASVDTAIRYRNKQRDRMTNVYCRLVHGHASGSFDPSNRLASGHLVLAGNLLPALVSIMRTHNENQTSDYRLKLLMDEPHYIEAWLDYPVWEQGACSVKQDEPVYMLRMATKEFEYALVLRCVDEKEQIYERIGLAHTIPQFYSTMDRLYNEHIEERY
jgi:hypothetical protein